MRSMPTFGGIWGVLGVAFGVLFCGVLPGVSGVFCEVLLMVSYFLSAIFFKCNFSGVNFTARMLATFPRKNGH